MKTNYADPKWLGRKYNRLTVIAFENTKRGKTGCWNWIVRCDCGTLKSVNPYRVLNGNTKSCGCYKAEQTIEYNKKEKVKHKGRRTRLYTIWHGMKQRCHCETSHDYKNYGARGIIVCDEWRNDFTAFREWALKNGYSDKLSIDRIDVNGNYCPENCRWTDCKTQNRNRTTNVIVSYRGKEYNYAELAEIAGISYGALYARINHFGWSVEKAVNTPLKRSS